MTTVFDQDALEKLSGLSFQFIQLSMIVFLRIGAALAVMPAFGEKTIPMRVRLTVAFAFCIIVTPVIAADIPVSAANSILVFASEPIIGLSFGIVIRLMIMILEVTGSIAAQSTSLAQLIGGAHATPQPAIGHVLTVSALALAAMMGLHVRVAEGFILSYEVFPVGVFPEALSFSDWGVLLFSQAFSAAFSLAAPFVILSLIYNVALGVINRAMPQLMVAFVGAPAITAGGLILLLLTAPLLLPIWQTMLEATLANPFRGW